MKLSELTYDMNEFDDDALVYRDDDEFGCTQGFNPDLYKDIKNKTMQIYAGYYEYPHKCKWKSPKIYLIGRGKNAGKFKMKVQGFSPYCYINSDDGEYKTYLGETVEKITFHTHPSKIARYRDMRGRRSLSIPHEADVLFIRRFLCDVYDYFKPKEAIQPKVAILDVETNFPLNDDIIAYSINNQEDNIVYNSKSYIDKSLYELAIEIYDYIYDYDVITGWNIEFDTDILSTMLKKIDRLFNYIRNDRKLSLEQYIDGYERNLSLFGDESRVLINMLIDRGYLKVENDIVVLGDKEFNPDIKKICAVLDMKSISKKMYARQIRGNWGLGNVGKQLCGVDKKHTGARHIKDMPEDELMEYNVMDTIIPEIIDNYLGGIQAHVILGWSLQSTLDEMIITAVVNDIALLRAYHREGIVLPSRDFTEDNTTVKYKAAEPDAKPGVYKGIIATDIVHAYPFAVIAYNISPETKDPNGEHEAPNGIRFNDKFSVFIETLKDLMKERGAVKSKLKKLKKNTGTWKRFKSIDFALKTQAAAFSHGIFGWAHSRMRDYEVADAITAVVRDIIDTIKRACENIGKTWCYVHTDSCYVNADKGCIEKLLKYLNNIISDKYSKSREVPTLEYKEFYPIGYIHSKARNVLVPDGIDINDDENWDVTGMNFMRSEVPEALIDIEINSIKQKLYGYNTNYRIYQLQDMIKQLANIDSRELGLIKPLKKPIKEYGRVLKDGTKGGYPGHIKALMRAMDEYGFNVSVGEKYMLLPIMTNETVGKKTKRRKKVEIAFSIETGLPKMYKIDFENYLKSNLWGKIHQLFDMTASELSKKVMTQVVKNRLGVK